MASPKIMVTLSTSPEIYDWLSKRAADNSRSRNAEMNVILKRIIEEEQSNA